MDLPQSFHSRRPLWGTRQRTTRVYVAIVILSTVGVGCGQVPRRATEEDCERWADHIADVLDAELDSATASCSATRAKAIHQAYQRAMADGKRVMVRACQSEADQGRKYLPKESQCFLAGHSLKDWDRCKFSTLTFQGAATDLREGVSNIAKTCRSK